MKLFAIFDRAADQYMTPFAAPTAALAMRSFEQGMADGMNLFATHRQDFSVYELGDFDQATGILTGTHPRRIDTATLPLAQVASNE